MGNFAIGGALLGGLVKAGMSSKSVGIKRMVRSWLPGKKGKALRVQNVTDTMEGVGGILKSFGNTVQQNSGSVKEVAKNVRGEVTDSVKEIKDSVKPVKNNVDNTGDTPKPAKDQGSDTSGNTKPPIEDRIVNTTGAAFKAAGSMLDAGSTFVKQNPGVGKIAGNAFRDYQMRRTVETVNSLTNRGNEGDNPNRPQAGARVN